MKTQSVLNLISRQRPKTRATKFVVLALAFILAAFTLPTTTRAGDRSSIKGPTVFAFFSNTDGCIDTSVFVIANDSVVHDPPGPPNPASEALIGVDQFDHCTFTTLLSAFSSATLTDAEFQVQIDGQRLNSALLDATINVFDAVSNSSFDVFVNLTWTGIGDPTHVMSHNHLFFPGFRLNSMDRGTARAAEAAGSVSDGVTNFTPNPTSSASIQNVTFGSVVIN